MKKFRNLKPWQQIVSIVLILVSANLFGAFAIPNLLMYLYDSGDNKETVHYDDGTIVYHQNGPLYDHVLFDHYSVSFEGEGRSEVCHINPGYEKTFDRTEINKFTFDKNGFIAYHVSDEDDAINEYRLFSAENESIQTFATMKELYDFCTENNIRLGKWYHGLHLEQTFFENNGWSLTTNTVEASFIRHNGEELFSGQIDKYFCTPRYLFFKFQHFDTDRYNEEPNPVIPIDESVVIRKRVMRRFFPFRDEIHTEKYICIDTETDNYTIFDDENSIEEYAASLGISQNWTKIKFDDKLNN